MPITRAPIAFAAVSAATPTPELMPVISSHSPERKRPCATSMSWTTMNVIGIVVIARQLRRARRACALVDRAGSSEASLSGES